MTKAVPICALLLAVFAASACAEESVSRSALRAFPPAIHLLFQPLPRKADPDARGGLGKGRGSASDAVAYVDGAPTSVLRFPELPDALPVAWKTLDDGRKVRRYRLAEYVEALGLALDDVSEVHLYGGRERVSIVTREELKKHRETLLFSFTGGTSGKPRMHYPPVDSIRINTFIDMLYNMAIYLKKTPPAPDPSTRMMTLDGQPVRGVPYIIGERPGGTRVYVGGKLSGWIKRKTLPDKLVLDGDSDETRRFSLGELLEGFGAGSRSRRVVLLSDDEVALDRAGPLGREDLAFTMPKHSKGQILVGVGETPRRISAVLVDPKPSPADPNAMDKP